MSCDKRITVILVFLLALEVSSDFFENYNGCKKAKIFRKGRRYAYSYLGMVENGVKGASEYAARMRISARVTFDFISRCEYSMQLTQVKVEESFGAKDVYRLTPSTVASASALKEHPLRFEMDHGIITDVRPVLTERRKDVLNIKRGILSAFQLKWSKERIVTETDVSGVCSVRYYVTRHKSGAKSVKKVKDLTSCEKRALSHSNIETIQYKPVSSIYDATSACEYEVRKKNAIEKVVCNEYYLVRPFSTPYGAGSYTNISQVIMLQKVQRIPHRKKTNSQEVYRTSLLYEHSHEEKSTSPDISKAVTVLQKLVQSKKNSPLIASYVAELIYAFRATDEQGIGKLLSLLSTCFDSATCNEKDLHSYRSYFFDGLSQCGTGACVNVIAGLITGNKIPAEQVENVLIALQFIQIPSPSMINAVMGIYKATENPAALLLLGTLMHKLCKHRPQACQEKGTIKNVISNAEFYLMHLLGNDCRKSEEGRNEVIYHTLKAIGNAGRPVQMKNVILDCLKHAVDAKISIAALSALRKMPWSDDVADALRASLIDRNVDPEKRMESFLLLMKNPTEADIVLSIDMVNDENEAHQMRSFLHSFLSAAVKNKDPSEKRLTDLFRKTLANTYITNFNPSASKFSKVYGNSFFNGYMDVGAGYRGYTVFHPESFLPRTINFAISTQILGNSIDVLEVNARMEGLEVHANKVLGDKGYLSKDFMKKIFEIPRTIGDSMRSRQKRSIGDDSMWAYISQLHELVNMKENIPDMDLSVRVFGNEIKLLKLKDIPLLNGDMDNFNFLEALYSLTKGRSASLQRNVLFLEGKYYVPTLIGLPLAFEINGSAAISLNLDGKVTVKNLVFGPKMATLQGSAVPSATLDISGKVTVYGISSKAGLRFHSRTHASSKVSGEVDYKEGKELKVNINAPDNAMDLFSYSHEMFHVVGANELAISGSKKRTKLNICTVEFANFSKKVGLDICFDFNFPVTYHDLGAPFYPLTGPASIKFLLQKTDASLKMYSLKVVQKNGVFEVDFSTPGALNSRSATMKLGFSPLGQRGIIGATFGDSKQGFLFDYVYDNVTNGLKTKFIWDVTGKEAEVSANFYNETDPATLDLQIGLDFSVKSSFVNGRSKLNFVDTYGYWGIDWSIDFGRKPLNFEVKVAYNPQTVFTRFAYGDKGFAVQLVPAYPLISYDMQVDWYPAVMNFTVKADLIHKRINIISNTSIDSFFGEIQWEKTNGLHKLVVTAQHNQEISKWLTHVDAGKNRKLFMTKMNIRGQNYGLRGEIRGSVLEIKAIGFPASMQAVVSRTSRVRSLSIFWNAPHNRGRLVFNLHSIGRMGKRKFCGVVRSRRVYYRGCVSASNQGTSKSMLAFEFTKDGNKSSVEFMRSLLKSKDADVAATKYVYTMKSRNSGITGILAKLEIDQNSKSYSERVSSFALQLPNRGFNIGVKIPHFDSFTRERNSTGWINLNYGLGRASHSFNIRIDNTWPSSGILQRNVEVKLKRNRINCTDYFSYIESGKRDYWTGSTNISRDTFILFSGTARLSQERLSMAQEKGRTAWEFKHTSSNSKPVLSNDGSLLEVKKKLEMAKPIAACYVELLMQPKVYDAKLNSMQVKLDALSNHIHYNMDLVTRVANLDIKLPKIDSNVILDYSKPDEYEALVDSSVTQGNKTTVINQARITVKKAKELGMWEVQIHHPSLKALIQRTESFYNLNYEKYRLATLNALNMLIGNAKVSSMTKKKISNLLMRESAFLLRNSTMGYENLEVKWRMLIREVINEQLEQALKQPSPFGISNSTMQNHVKKLAPMLDGIVEDALTFDKLKSLFQVERLQAARKSLIDIARSRKFKQAVIREARRAILKHNLPEEAKRAMIKMIHSAIGDLNLSGEIPVLMLSYVRHQLNSTWLAAKSPGETFIKSALKSLNVSNADLIHILSNAESYFQDVFKEIDRKTNLNDQVKKILQKPYGKHNLTSILAYLSSMNDFGLKHIKMGRRFLQRKLMNVSSLIPKRWMSRIDPIVKKLMAAVDDVKDEDIASNATIVLFNIGEVLFTSVADYIATNFSSDIEEHLSVLMNTNILYGNFTLSQYWERALQVLQERFLFGLRLTGQVFPKRVEYLHKRYLKDGDILFVEMYKDLASTDFVSPQNIAMIKKMFSSIGRRIFLEMSQATGNFSTGSSLLNVLNFARNVDLKDFNSVIRNYERIKNIKHDSWSVAILMANAKDALKNLGKIKIGNQTLNDQLAPMVIDFNRMLPKLIRKGKNIEKLVERAFGNATNSVIRACNRLKGIVAKYSGIFREDSAKWRKFAKFASELTIPSLGMAKSMLVTMVKRQRIAGSKSELENVVDSFKQNDPFNLTSYVISLIENTDKQLPERMWRTLLMTLSGDIQHVQSYLLRRMRAFERQVLKNQKEIRSGLAQLNRYLRRKAKLPLHKLLQKSLRLSTSYMKSLANSSILYDLQKDVGSIYDFSKLRRRIASGVDMVAKETEKVLDSLDVKKLQSMANSKLPNFLEGLASQLAEGVIVALKQVNASKDMLLRGEYLLNPKSYLLSLPKQIMGKVRQRLSQERMNISRWLSSSEALIRQHIMERKVAGAFYMEKIQNYLREFDTDLEKLDYFAAVYRMMKKLSEERILLNYTSQLKDGLRKLQTEVKDAMKAEGNSLLQAGMGRIRQEISKTAISDDQARKRISSFINKLRVVARQGMENMTTVVARVDSRTQATRRRLYQALKIIENRIKILQRDFKTYIKVVDESTIVLLVPEMDFLQKQFLGYFSSNRNKPLAKDSAIIQTIDSGYPRNDQMQYSEDNGRDSFHVRKFPSMDASARSPLQNRRTQHRQFVFPGAASVGVDSANRKYMAKDVFNYTSSSTVSREYWPLSNETVVTVSVSSKEYASRSIVLKSVMESLFKAAQKYLNFLYKLPQSGEKMYQAYFAKFYSDFSNMARLAYSKQIMVPLKRISKVATIPIPAEKLQSFISKRSSWKKAARLFTPASATATFYNGHVITFDGKYVYLPSVDKSCTYLLSRDFKHGMFTFLVKAGQLHMYVGKMGIVLSKYGKIVLMSQRGVEDSNLPTEIEGTLIRTTGKLIEIISSFGLKVTCNTGLFMCDFEVPGIFHNNTLGIFGSNNAEFADDFKLPNGLIADDLLTFIKSWRIYGEERCNSLKSYHFTSVCIYRASRQCSNLFKFDQSLFSKAFTSVNPLPYFSACQHDTSSCSLDEKQHHLKYCNVASLYVKRAYRYGIKLEMPAECATCRINGQMSQILKFNSQPRMADIVLIVRDSVHSKRALRNLKSVVQRLDNLFNRLKVDVRYKLVGFGGIAYRSNPYIQTGQNKVTGDVDDLVAAIDNLQYRNTVKVQSGLDALKFASKLDLRPMSSKIFIVLDTVAIYSGSLRQMVETNNMLVNKGIILNVINRYKLKKGVIGQDSFNTRYHLKIPRGERLRSLIFPTSDDYVPIVKESGGAVMTVKGLLSSSNEKWVKAFPISLKQIILNQIKKDGRACKLCSCVEGDMSMSHLQCTNTNQDTC